MSAQPDTMPWEDEAPTAVEPSRVLILSELDQYALLEAISADEDPLHDLVAHGPAYLNDVDELTRLTLRKRRLEAEAKRCSRRIADLEPGIVEQWAAEGSTGMKHAATGATLRLDRKLWARVDVDVDGLPKDEADAIKAQAKARAGQVMQTLDEFDGMVRPDFNLNTLSARFREAAKEHDEAQRDLPEHERTPLDLGALIPDALRGLIVLDATPHVVVRA